MRRFLLICCLLPLYCCSQSENRIHTLLDELDRLVESDQEYIQLKEQRIQQLQTVLVAAGKKEELYSIHQQISQEFETYNCDSAITHSRAAMLIASELKKSQWLNESRIQLARCEARAGLFINTLNRLQAIDRSELSPSQKALLYAAYIDAYIYWLEYQTGYDTGELQKKKEQYQDSLLKILPTSTYEYAIRKGFRLIETGKLDSAEHLLKVELVRVTVDSKERAGVTSILSFLYNLRGDLQKEKENLAVSAISDIKSAIKENISLRALSIILFQEGDMKRADRYIKKSLDDANFYNARLRNIQASKILPIIDKAYQKDKEKQQAAQRNLLIAVSILSVILFVSIILILRQIRALRIAQVEILSVNNKLTALNGALQAAGERQKLTNINLAEANHIKEKFIGQFLEICTEHIDRLELFKLMVNRKLKAGLTNELMQMTSATSQDAARELKTLYASFDIAFLNIYPDFVESFNKLLRPDQQYDINDSRSLNQELRVFALLRLGIADSNKIATFLHYSLRTIYNYRSKVKSKAIDPDENFEERVKEIGSFSRETIIKQDLES